MTVEVDSVRSAIGGDIEGKVYSYCSRISTLAVWAAGSSCNAWGSSTEKAGDGDARAQAGPRDFLAELLTLLGVFVLEGERQVVLNSRLPVGFEPGLQAVGRGVRCRACQGQQAGRDAEGQPAVEQSSHREVLHGGDSSNFVRSESMFVACLNVIFPHDTP